MLLLPPSHKGWQNKEFLRTKNHPLAATDIFYKWHIHIAGYKWKDGRHTKALFIFYTGLKIFMWIFFMQCLTRSTILVERSWRRRFHYLNELDWNELKCKNYQLLLMRTRRLSCFPPSPTFCRWVYRQISNSLLLGWIAQSFNFHSLISEPLLSHDNLIVLARLHSLYQRQIAELLVRIVQHILL